MKISLTQTYFGNRIQYLKRNLRNIENDDRISEIILSNDDGSEVFKLDQFVKDYPKVKLYHNKRRLHCFRNNIKTIQRCENEWCILLDSDNIITTEFIDKLYEQQPWDDITVYTPGKAGRHDFTGHPIKEINKDNIIEYYDIVMARRDMNMNSGDIMNLFNCLINRDTYMKCAEVWLSLPDSSIPRGLNTLLHGHDSMFANYLLMFGGATVKVLDNLEYDHTVHDGSYYLEVAHLAGKAYPDVVDLMRSLGYE